MHIIALPKNLLRLFILFTLIVACETDEKIEIIDKEEGGELIMDPETELKMFQNKSQTSPLVKLDPSFNSVKAFSLLSTTDTIGGNFRLAGSADGAGFLKDGDNYLYVVNNEYSYSVARVRLDKYLNPISGDYLLNSGVANYARQCSATMWEANIHGGSRDIFLSASESEHYQVKGIDPWVSSPTPHADFSLPALGEFSWENAVPLPRDAYPGKTVIIGGDDDATNSQGQLVLYLSENGDMDLENGKVYVLRTKQISDGQGGAKFVDENEIYTEANFDFGISYEIEFVELEDAKNLTKNETEELCDQVFATRFMRVEDVDYQKGSHDNARNIFFAATGRGPDRGTYNDWGTIYRLELSMNNPLKGQLTQIVSGNTNTNKMDGNLPELQNPDNLCVTENYIYIQEDPNSFSRGHSAYIYQSDLDGNNIKKVLELLIDENLAPGSSLEFSGEFGSLIDISDKVQLPGTFLLALQPNYWRSEDFKGLDGHFSDFMESNKASQIVLLKGLPR